MAAQHTAACQKLNPPAPLFKKLEESVAEIERADWKISEAGKYMRLLFVADGRSPIALNWAAHFVQARHEVHWVSTYPCHIDLPWLP